MTLKRLAKRRVVLREGYGGTQFTVDVIVSVNVERDVIVVTAEANTANVDVISMDHLSLEEGELE